MLWGFKKEGFQANPWTGKILSDHDIPVAYKSDHPVLNAQHLLYEAQIGHHYGLKESLAIASLTSVPAKAIGMDHRIGYVRVGYDADVVIWDAYPLSLGAVPVQVFIDGVELFDAKIAEKKLEGEFNPAEGIPRQREWDETEVMNMDGPKKELEKKDFVATGIKKAYIRGEGRLETLSATSESLTMVVRNGSITCLSSSCEPEMHSANSDGVPIRHLNNGYILPGLTLLSPSHGLAEIVSERTTLDGLVDSSKDPKDTKSVIYAKDGLTFGGKHLERAHAAGILNLVTAPLSNGFSQGVSVAFKSGGDSVLQKGAVIKEDVALHFQISHDSNGGSTPTISSQIATLKQILLDSVNDTDSIYGRAANGQIPLAVTAQNKDIIAHLLDVKASISKTAPINLVIIGGIEAYLLANELASANVPVILAPWRCQPESWEIRNCLPGPPISEKTSFQILLEAGVDVALAAWDDGLIIGMYWEASWAARGTELTEKDVVKLISTDVERILGIEFEDSNDGHGGGHVLFEGNPLDFGANVAAIIP